MENIILTSLTPDELRQLIREELANINSDPQNENNGEHIYGLKGLCELLNCSHETAQRIKNSGKIPFIQIGRKLIFNKQAVLKALSNKKK